MIDLTAREVHAQLPGTPEWRAEQDARERWRQDERLAQLRRQRAADARRTLFGGTGAELLTY